LGSGGAEELRRDQQLENTTRSGPEIENGKSSTNDSAPECSDAGQSREEDELDPLLMSESAARRILFPFYPAEVREQKKIMTVKAKSEQ